MEPSRVRRCSMTFNRIFICITLYWLTALAVVQWGVTI
jgi:hypothetical protein